jgi:hypothetical protein
MLHTILYSFITSFLLFGAYVELNPSMTNIWWRINSEGVKQIRIENLYALMLAPFKYSFYWYPTTWDINFFIWWISIYLSFYLANNNTNTNYKK